ncbi:MAG: hypothetical protein GY851_16225 [bacterium]|nr:hypothetical protein [bacterium]
MMLLLFGRDPVRRHATVAKENRVDKASVAPGHSHYNLPGRGVAPEDYLTAAVQLSAIALSVARGGAAKYYRSTAHAPRRLNTWW